MNDLPSMRVDVNAITSGRRLIIYGAGRVYERVRRIFPDLRPDVIIDDSPGHRGVVTEGIPVTSFDATAPLKPSECFVLICVYANTAVQAIRTKLAAFGFRFPLDVTDASILLWQSMARRIPDLGVAVDDDLFRATHCLSMEIPVRNESSVAGTSLSAHMIRACIQRCGGNVCEFGAYQGAHCLIVTSLLHSLFAERSYPSAG